MAQGVQVRGEPQAADAYYTVALNEIPRSRFWPRAGPVGVGASGAQPEVGPGCPAPRVCSTRVCDAFCTALAVGGTGCHWRWHGLVATHDGPLQVR